MYRKFNYGRTEQQTETLHALSGWQLLAEQNYLQSFPQLQSGLCVFISSGRNAIQNAEFFFSWNICVFWTIKLVVQISHQLPEQ